MRNGCIRNFMRCQRATLLFHFGLLFITGFPLVISDLIYQDCNDATTHAEGSRFSTNLHRVMDDLLRNTPLSGGFNTSSHGQTNDTVYGLLQCLANVSSQMCAKCSKEAIDSVQQKCGNDLGGRVWMDGCFLRYENFNFFSKLDVTAQYQTNDTDLPNLRSIMFDFLSNLCKKAYESASKRFALGAANYSSTNKVYGLAECWRDISLDDCRTCLKIAMEHVDMCCPAAQGVQAVLRSCILRFEIYPFFKFAEYDDGTWNAKSNKKSINLPLILGVVGGVIVVFAVCIFGIIRCRSAISRRTITLVTRNEENPESVMLTRERNIIFKLETLIDATQNFHDKNKLGEGGFGPVYKGTTREGTQIAVKKLSARSGQGRKEFMNEVKLMANVRHRNLVKLLGCCAEGTERLLVYEYLQNRSLDTFLFDSKRRRQLDWETRYNIIVGIARGLLYLHEDSHVRIIHRDIKANNILLDDKMNPKISDFGLARLFPDDETHVQTRIAGTYGYMAPEYAMRGQLSVKADIFSFGVLILEILSGRKNSDINFPEESQSLLEWAWTLHKRGDLLNMVDSTVSETCGEEQAVRCIQVGLLCVQADAAIRPQISNIILMISRNSVKLPNPSIPAYVGNVGKISYRSPSTSGLDKYDKGTPLTTLTDATSSTASYQSHWIPSTNETSITQVEPR